MLFRSEQKLEIDKRHILNRAADIRKELREVKQNRETQRVQRLKSNIPIVALVGYTNAGKSTLLNELIKTHKDYETEKEVFVKDMLFATLDVTLRKATLPNKRDFLVVDTVGFVHRLQLGRTRKRLPGRPALLPQPNARHQRNLSF